MEVGDRAAQLRDRGRDGRVGARFGAVGIRLGRHIEVVAGGEQVLDRAVVQILRELPALALLGGERLRDEALPLCREQPHGGLAPRQQQGEEGQREPEPGQVGRLDEHERERARAGTARVRSRLQHVDRSARHGHRGRHQRPPAERDGDDREKEREAQLREAAARAVGERAREGDVRDHEARPVRAGRRDPGPRTGACPPRTARRPRARRGTSPRSPPAWERRPRPTTSTGHGDDAEQRGEALRIHAPGLVHSTMPRRIASATAAARSETPSFSYSLPRCDLTVVVPR